VPTSAYKAERARCPRSQGRTNHAAQRRVLRPKATRGFQGGPLGPGRSGAGQAPRIQLGTSPRLRRSRQPTGLSRRPTADRVLAPEVSAASVAGARPGFAARKPRWRSQRRLSPASSEAASRAQRGRASGAGRVMEEAETASDQNDHPYPRTPSKYLRSEYRPDSDALPCRTCQSHLPARSHVCLR